MYLKAIGQGFHAEPSPTLGSLPAGLKAKFKARVFVKAKERTTDVTCTMIPDLTCPGSMANEPHLTPRKQIFSLIYCQADRPAAWRLRSRECCTRRSVFTFERRSDVHITFSSDQYHGKPSCSHATSPQLDRARQPQSLFSAKVIPLYKHRDSKSNPANITGTSHW